MNFGGYHAEAGLGGLLTGNAAHGGLTASAGTPFGQTAHAGLGGNTGRKSILFQIEWNESKIEMIVIKFSSQEIS